MKKNRTAFFKYLNIDRNRLAIPVQTHSAHIEFVEQPGVYKNTDALITKTKGIILTIQAADCFPVFIFDPQKEICAIVHSGWRGTAQNIAGKTIGILLNEFHCKPESLLAAIGAGIQQENYQIDLQTADHFEKKYCMADGKDHYKLDIQGKIGDQLIQAGVIKNNIEYDTRCTFKYKDLFYSYRRDGQNSGRMMGLIGLL